MKTSSRSKSKRFTSPTALITGASSGIGYAFAEDFLANQGWGEYKVLVMVAHNSKRLKEAASRLQKQYPSGPKILTLATDLSQPQSVVKVMAWIKRNRLQIVSLVNNAGIGYMGSFQNMSEEKIQKIINLNITSLTTLTHAMLEHIRDGEYSVSPVIINVASVVGFLPFPLSTVYAASKAYVINFSEALRSELKVEYQSQQKSRNRGVEVYTLCPGSTHTSFFERAGGKHRGLITTEQFMDPAQVVKETREAVLRKQGLIIPGAVNRLIPLLGRLLPRRLAIKIAHQFMKRRLR